MNLSAYHRDVIERVFWTAAEALVAVLLVHTTDLDALYVAPATAVLSLIKSIIAKHIGDNTAALPLWASEAIATETVSVAEEVIAKAKKRPAKK